MNNIVTNVIMFAAGAVVASAVTWKVTKTKYDNLAQREIDEVKKCYEKKNSTADISNNDEKDGISEYKKKLSGLSYSVGIDISKKGEPTMKTNGPYVISPDEFGENDYETVSFTYYADKVLTDEFDEVVEDVNGTIGYDSLLHFGEYEDDAVFVRNDQTETDYEILMVTRNYYGDVVDPAEE